MADDCRARARRSPSRVSSWIGDLAQETVDVHAAVGTGPAARGQRVVGARGVVPGAFGRVIADEDAARGRDLRRRCPMRRASRRSGAPGRRRWRTQSACIPASNNTIRLLARANSRIASPRLRCRICSSTARVTCRAKRSVRQTRMAWLSSPCSACDSRSAATNSARALLSASTITSEGPAGRSTATASVLTSCLARVTYRFPGPKILSTCGMLSVP